MRSALASVVLCGISIGVGSCTQASEGVTISDTVTTTLRVEAVDPVNRQVVLRQPDGRRMIVTAGPEVRHLDQIAVGDVVAVTYEHALLADVVKPETGRSEADSSVEHATPSARPGVAVRTDRAATVKINGVDPLAGVVEFTGPDGVNRRVVARTPEGKRFIRGLKRGDEVQLRWRDALVIRVEPQR